LGFIKPGDTLLIVCLIVWPPFQAFSQHKELALLFLEYTLSILHKEPVIINSSEKRESTSESLADDCILQATMFALNAFMRYWSPFDGSLLMLRMVGTFSSADFTYFKKTSKLYRGGGKIGKQAVEKSYPSVLSGLILKLESLNGVAKLGRNELLW
jgi:maestro heat-like repeat-containing protein family member 1